MQVKKVSIAVALAALCGLAANSFADVQNIRLSGDIRVRGYLLENAGDNGSGDQAVGGSSFIEQRTRVCVEADLEDHVLVVVTLKAESLWGANNQSLDNAGAGSTGAAGAINRTWDVGLDEAYVQFNEVFYTPATVKLGRQYLNYGHGLILSSYDQEYNYDAGRLVMDYYPLTIDLVGAEVVNNQAFAATGSHLPSSDLLFVNARYEMTDSLLKDVEGYFGYLSQGSSSTGPLVSSRVPPTAAGSSPLIVGLRTDMNLTEGLNTWAEGAYEFGSGGPGNESISSFLANLGIKFGRKDWTMTPVFNASYTFADGGGNTGEHSFRPWFDYAEGYNGYLFAPALSNLNIFNVGASIKPWENTTLALQGYYYYKVDRNYGVGSNPNVDFGGLGYGGPSASKDVGAEVDAILGYDYSKDVRCQLVNGIFFPLNGIADSGVNSNRRVADEVRAELDVKF
jgi:hypothetical protein